MRGPAWSVTQYPNVTHRRPPLIYRLNGSPFIFDEKALDEKILKMGHGVLTFDYISTERPQPFSSRVGQTES